MAEGTSTFKGLAVPLSGESEIKQITAATDMLTLTGATSMSGDFLVMQDVDGTEVNAFYSDGRIMNTIVHDSDMNTATGVTYMEGVHFGTTVTANSGGSDALSCVLQHNSTTWTNAGQIYVAEFWLGGGASAGMTGGRTAVLNLIIDHDTSYAQVDAATSYINFTADDALIPAFFTLTGETADGAGGCFIANVAPASTHALRIYVANTAYYLMCTTCVNS